MTRKHMGSRGAKREYYTRYLAGYTRKNSVLLLLGGLFVLGVFLGALLLRSASGESLELLMRLTDHYLFERARQNLGQVFFSCASSSLFFVGVLFICGFCAISHPAVLCIPLFRGLGFGFSVSGLYAAYGVGAAGYVALFLVPDMLLTGLVILLCCREALRLSSSFLASVKTEHKDRDFYSLRIFIARFFAASVFCLLSAFLQAVLYTAFANYIVLR